MNHVEVRELLAVYRDLRGAERTEVDGHLATCSECAAELQSYRKMDVALSALRDSRPENLLRERFYAAVQQKPIEPGPRRNSISLVLSLAPAAGAVVLVCLFGALILWQGRMPGIVDRAGPAHGTPEASLPAQITPMAIAQGAATPPEPAGIGTAKAVVPEPTATPQPAGMRRWDVTTVALDIFSGRPNPVWDLPPEQEQQLRAMLQKLPEVACRALDLPLGYRGFVVQLAQRPELSNEYRVRVYEGQVRYGDPWTPNTVGFCVADQNRDVERFLLAGARPHLDDNIYSTVETALGKAPVAAGTAAPSPAVLAAASRPATSATGMVAYYRDGAVWAMALPDGQPRRLAPADQDATLRWSSSGRWLAYRYRGGLWVVRSDGTQAQAVDDCPLPYGSRPWSPATDELICVGSEGVDVMTLAANADARRRIVPIERSGPGSGILSIHWSPDGKMLAYERVDTVQGGGGAGWRASIWRVQADGTGAKELVNGGDPSPDRLIVAGWSPGGAQVLFYRNEGFSGSLLADGATLWAVPAAGGRQVQLGGDRGSDARRSRDRVLAYPDFLEGAPQTVGGQQLAVVFGGYRASWTNKQVAVVDASTGNTRPLSPEGVSAISPSWSPDGRTLAYVAMPDAGDLVGGETASSGLLKRRIYLADTQGGAPRQVTNDNPYRDERPIWLSADEILFARIDAEDKASLWIVRTTGEAPPRMIVDGLALDPQTKAIGYYGNLEWGNVYDLWAPRAY